MATGQLGGLAGWVVDVIESIGAVGVGALIALENIFPPIPSEVILPFAGFSAARGSLDPGLAWAAATVGAVVGAYVLYGICAFVGYDRVPSPRSRAVPSVRKGVRPWPRTASTGLTLTTLGSSPGPVAT